MLVTCRRCGVLHRRHDAALHPLCDECSEGGDDPHRSTPFHALRETDIERAVEWIAPGTFVLGYLDGSAFIVFYVGRSDTDVGSTLMEWVGARSAPPRRRQAARLPWQARPGAPAGFGRHALGPTELDTGYTHFAFHYASSPIDAFERECRAFHALGGSDALDNQRHPDPPPGLPWACPVHGV